MKNEIKNIVVSILIIFTFSAARSDNQTNELLYITHVNKLKLTTVDSKCGEWGGDKRIVTIYRDSFKGQLLADYVEETKDCNSDKKNKITKSIKRIKLNQQDKSLIISCINELFANKLNREDYPSHSGLLNQALLTDSSINIQDFPAKKWEKFTLLITKLKAK
ncbi:hypothetical protein EZ428_22445 [Pedobacter frigiditerrae]|uniref:Uncharacterized protein n=1 Tax=Pedobacter frigiditerrae TaxID=2530452 RepID=A0A4R0MK39_9SPHI|nr:hypothetical protein [Pedobacter frigiditerrae]TCC86968.1 hypothetical protein EZ428_22445 [Pedobacter frigiditerrae]